MTREAEAEDETAAIQIINWMSASTDIVHEHALTVITSIIQVLELKVPYQCYRSCFVFQYNGVSTTTYKSCTV